MPRMTQATAFDVKKGDTWEIKMLSVTPIIESKEAANTK
jgi:hypothetical protein